MVLRVILGQPGPRAPLRTDDVVVSSEVVRIETARVLDRLRVTGSLTDAEHAAKAAAATSLLSTFHLFLLADEMVDAACEKYAVEVSALCAMHVATAQQVQKEVGELQFWTHAPQQALAALARGFDVRGAVLRS